MNEEYVFEYKKCFIILKKSKIKMQNSSPAKNKTGKTGMQTLYHKKEDFIYLNPCCILGAYESRGCIIATQ